MRITLKSVLFALALAISLSAMAQPEYKDWRPDSAKVKPFRHVELGVIAGSTGIGFDLTTKINKTLQIRAGFSVMPHIFSTTDFYVRSGTMDSEGNWERTDINKFVEYFEEVTGFNVDTKVDMKRIPNMRNFNLLLDVFPFHKKSWRATVGFYVGPSTVANSVNTTEEMTALVAVGMYNNIYDKVVNNEPLYNDVYLDPDVEDKMLEYGRLGIRLGEYVADGKPYIMDPDDKNMVKAKVKVNSFKPYFGIGYSGRLIKGDDRFGFSFDLGVMTWGGTPKMITHDGTDLIRDVKNITGKVGNYVHTIERIKAYPVLNIRFSRVLF